QGRAIKPPSGRRFPTMGQLGGGAMRLGYRPPPRGNPTGSRLRHLAQYPGGGPFGSVTYETTSMGRRRPTGIAHASGGTVAVGFADGKRRSAGRTAHDAIVNTKNIKGGVHWPGPSPTST